MFFKISTIAALVATATAHMALVKPCTRWTPHGENCPAPPAGQSVDYNLNAPLGASQPLCKYTTPYDTPVETWTAGQSVTVKFDPTGAAAHGGGHCEFSLSYDGGKTFVVVHQELKYCFFNGPSSSNTPQVTSYTFNLPTDLPSSNKAVFQWTWVNAIGNREFYSNCADVAIKGSSKSFTGKELTIANHNGYPTIPEFNGNYDTGLEHYKNAKQITVTGNGSTGPAPVPSSSAAPSYTSAAPSYTSIAPPVGHTPSAPAPVPTSSAPAVTSSVGPAPTAAPVPSTTAAPGPGPTTAAPLPTQPAGGACTHGAMRCAADGSGFQTCVWGVWDTVTSCSGETKCKANGDSIVCDWV
ncbi:hypothetical protein EC988_005162 [Linderina pennispora]|nr:hypothetical protein EC988_005162 [Linderina pennispora]